MTEGDCTPVLAFSENLTRSAFMFWASVFGLPEESSYEEIGYIDSARQQNLWL